MAPRRLDSEAAGGLLAALPAFAPIVDEVGPVELGPPLTDGHEPGDAHFAVLVRTVCYQQLAGGAARAIHERVVDRLGGRVTAARVLAAGDDELRDAGLSRRKAETIAALAREVDAGEVDLAGVDQRTDEEIVRALTSVRGVGRWTAEMFLIFQLHRADVWPATDLGVRRGYALIHGLEQAPRPRMLEHLGEPYRPWRTAAAWYCWRAVDATPPGTDPWS